MKKNKFSCTTETRLNNRNSSTLMNYITSLCHFYTTIFMSLWHEVNKYGIKNLSKKDYKRLMNQYNISKRFAISIITDVIGRYNAIKELKKYELKQLQYKKESLLNKISDLKNTINSLKLKVVNNNANKNELQEYLKNKRELFYKSQKLNRINHKIIRLLKVIASERFSICFGTKKLFKAQYHLAENNLKSHEEWLEKFRQNRDKTVFFLGDRGDPGCNQHVQLIPCESGFRIKFRTIDGCPAQEKYIYAQCSLKDKLYSDYIYDNLLKDPKLRKALSYRFVIKNEKIYLKINFEYEPNAIITSDKKLGVVGLDYNDGFIQLAETNNCGNLIYLEKIPLVFHGTGNSATSEIREKAIKIIQYCQSKNKPLAIEDLDFSKKKAKTLPAKKNKGKKYNLMIHEFDYSRYRQTIESACYKNSILLIKVNPAYTSKIASQKYCKDKKINTHQGASYVIARRAQGFKDTYNHK